MKLLEAASIESLLVFLVIIALSSLSNWLKKKQGQTEDTWPKGVPAPPHPQPGPEPAEPPQTAPPVSWEEELRRLLDPDAPPAPTSRPRAKPAPPKPPVVIIDTPRPSAPPPPVSLPTPRPIPQPYSIPEPLIARSPAGPAPGPQVLEMPLHGMPQTTFARHPKPPAAAALRPSLRRADAARAVAMLRHPATTRQAVMVSFILGPAKALEHPALSPFSAMDPPPSPRPR